MPIGNSLPSMLAAALVFLAGFLAHAYFEARREYRDWGGPLRFLRKHCGLTEELPARIHSVEVYVDERGGSRLITSLGGYMQFCKSAGGMCDCALVIWFSREDRAPGHPLANRLYVYSRDGWVLGELGWEKATPALAAVLRNCLGGEFGNVAVPPVCLPLVRGKERLKVQVDSMSQLLRCLGLLASCKSAGGYNTYRLERLLKKADATQREVISNLVVSDGIPQVLAGLPCEAGPEDFVALAEGRRAQEEKAEMAGSGV